MKASIATEEAPYEWVIARLSWKFSVFEFDEEEEKVEEKTVCKVYWVGVCLCACGAGLLVKIQRRR